MAIVSFWETGLRRGSFPDATSWSAEHNFPVPGVQVWSRPYLQSASMGDASAVMLTVSDFTGRPTATKKADHRGGLTPTVVEDHHALLFDIKGSNGLHIGPPFLVTGLPSVSMNVPR